MAEGRASSIAGFQCLKCGKVSFPGHTRCRSCRGTEFKDVPLRRGRIVTSTRLAATRPGFASELVLAVAEFESGVRVLGQVQGGVPQTGAPVGVGEGILAHRKDESEVRGFVFIPLRSSK